LERFAQSEMVDTFIYGVNPGMNDFYVKAIGGLAATIKETVIDSIDVLTPEQREACKVNALPHVEKAVEDLVGEVVGRLSKNSYPIMQALVHLPKDELAHVAEALVNLNSFQKKVSMEDETVGGPIDVAVISKGDGLIWIKRKHYFQ